jgi:hypothetical protein
MDIRIGIARQALAASRQWEEDGCPRDGAAAVIGSLASSLELLLELVAAS